MTQFNSKPVSKPVAQLSGLVAGLASYGILGLIRAGAT